MRTGRPRLAPLMLRELRGSRGRLAFFVACLAVGVAAVVAVAGVSAGLDSGLRREARRLLAADLVVEGPEPVPAELGEVLGELVGSEASYRRADVRELVTMVSAGSGGGTGAAVHPGRSGGSRPPARLRPAGLRPGGSACRRLADGRACPAAVPAGSAGADTSARELPDRPWTSRGLHRPPVVTALHRPRPLPPKRPISVPAARERREPHRPVSVPAGTGAERAANPTQDLTTAAGREGAPSSPPGGEERDGERWGRSQLVELKVVEGGYPFYGEMELKPDRSLDELLEGGGVVAAPELLERLGLGVGDVLSVGGVEAEIRAVVLSEPDRLGGAFGFSAGPRLFVGAELFERTGLETTGSRIRYRALVALPEGAPRDAAEAWAERIRAALPPSLYNVETWTEAQPALRSGLARAERFLGLVALLSLLVGGIGVGQTVRAWLAGRLDAVAVLKVLGLRPREIALVYAGQVALLGLAGSLVGAAAGVVLQMAIPRLASDVVPPGLIDPFQPGAVARGIGLGLGVALLFGLPSLGVVLRVPPVRVLRRAVEPLPVPRTVAVATGVALAGGVWATAGTQSGSVALGGRFTLGALAATGLLALAAWGLSRLAGSLPRVRATRAVLAGRFWLRHGLASLARPGAATLAAVVALGLGTLVVVALWLVERRLTDALVGNLPEEAPSVFLVDVQPDQWPGVREILRAEGATGIDSVPVVMARLAAVDGVGVRELATPEGAARDPRDGERRDEGERRWALTREQRLTYLDELPEGNRVIAGELWSAPGTPEVSVEEEFARELGVDVGSTLRFDVQGVPVELAVTSLRTVDWSTFGINFFLVVEPGVLDRAPQHRVAAAQVPPEAETRLQDRIAATFPNVTVLRVREILDKVVTTLRRIADGVRFVGAFTVLAGVAILAGAVSAGEVRRRREVALLKTLGTTRAGVVAVYAVEYALVGLVAGLIGCGGATVLARTVLVRGMEVDWVFEPLPLLAAVGATVLVTVLAGLAASARALQSRPMEVMRR